MRYLKAELLIVVLLVSTLCGCITPAAKNDWVEKNGQVLDRMTSTRNEYGTVGMSSPMLVLPDGRFKFDLSLTTKDFFTQAKSELQGRAAAMQQDVDIAALGLSVQVDPTQMAAYSDMLQQFQLKRLSYLQALSDRDRLQAAKQGAHEAAARLKLKSDLDAANTLTEPQRSQKTADAYQNYSDAVKVPDAPLDVNYPTAPSDGSDVPAKAAGGPTGATQSRTILPGDGKFAAAQNLLGTNPAVTTNNRSALITAAGDTAVQAIFAALGQPQEAQKFQDKKTVFGVAMVSVEPGWRTQEDFAAHLTVRPETEWKRARKAVVDNILKKIDKKIW